MFVIKSKKTAEFVTPDGNLGELNEAVRFSDPDTANKAMDYWDLRSECRVRRLIGGKHAN